MSDPINKTFNVVVPITKCYKRKSTDGTEKYVIEGMASNTNLDLTGERMADTAIEAMSKSLDTHKVYLNNEHSSDWDSDFGEITSLWKTNGHELMMEAELDPEHYRTKTLVRAMEKGKKLGLSIEGWVQDSAIELDEAIGKMVKTYKDILLSKISITGTPAVADTWFAPITKSVNWSETPMPHDAVVKTDEQEEQVATEEVVEVEEVVTEETAEAAEVEETETPESETTETSTEVEKTEAQDETTPVEVEAAAQEDEAVAGEQEAEAAPEQAEGDTSEEEAPAEEVGTVQPDGSIKWEEVQRSLTSAQEEVATLKKSVSTLEANNEELKKSLDQKTEEIDLLEKSLAESRDQLELSQARKSLVTIDKFAGVVSDDELPEEATKAAKAILDKSAQEIAERKVVAALNEEFAAFAVGAK